MTSTTIHPTALVRSKQTGVVPTLGMTSKSEKNSVAQQKTNGQMIDRVLLNSFALSPTAGSPTTIAYRWHGEDTLTLGNIGEWVTASYIRSSFKASTERPDDYEILIDYSNLHQVLSIAKLPEVRSVYEFRTALNVTAFLASHPTLIDWLLESHATFAHYFGNNAKFILEAVSESEGAHQEQLVIAVRSNHSVDEAMNRLDLLDQNWLFEQIDIVGDKVIVNLEFV
ncbi:MAG: hypothetical protein U0175_08035 [Caldilineaceae bacterium]